MIEKYEFVCTANNGKSPIALAVAREILKDKPNYSLTSTGIMVDIITRSDGPKLVKYLSQFCKDAYDRVILTQAEIDGMYKNPRMVLERFLTNERKNRNQYLKELGLEFNDYPTQTHAVRDSGIIACIGDSNLKRVKGIYDGSGFKPQIVNLMGEDYPDISNQWVLTYEEFRNLANDIRDATTKLIELKK